MEGVTEASRRPDRPLSAIVNAVGSLDTGRRNPAVQDVVDALGRASGLSIMLIAASIATTPLSGIPGLSGFCGIIIALSAAQLFFGRTTIWLPSFVRRRTVDKDRLARAVDTLRKPAAFFDRHTRNRLTWFVRGPGKKLVQGLCVAAGMMMPLLELIPFSASIAGGTVALFTIALLTLDGLWALLGFSFLATAGTTAYMVLS